MVASTASVADFITTLQLAKKANGDWNKTSLAERKRLLIKARENLVSATESIAKSEAKAQNLNSSFVKEVSIKRALEVFDRVLLDLEQTSEANLAKITSTGLISVILPAALSFRFAIEMIVPALAAGNVVLVKTSSQSTGTKELLVDLFKDMPANLVNVLNGSREVLGDLFSGHPSIQAVAFCGSVSSTEKIIKSSLPTLKKLKLYLSGNNSALILDGTDLEFAAKALCESCFAGNGLLRESISKIFVLESQIEKFMEYFLNLGEHSAALAKISKERFSELKTQVVKDAGKIISAESAPMIVKDLSHCSVLQQDPIGAPLAIVSAVKYQHEMLKWANTGYLGVCAQVFGPAEKALKIASALEVGKVYINSWLPQDPSTTWGHKNSSYGIEDSAVFGAFFSERKFFVGV